MSIAFFDCFSGVSGDMCLGALVGAGVDFDRLRQELAGLPVEGYTLRREKVIQSGITADNITVALAEFEQPARHLPEIEQLIDAAGLPERVKEASKQVFQTLARAEARVHGTSPDKIHFHEVGAVDAIIDVVGTVLGLHLLGVDKVYISPLPLGSGFIHCRHGVIPSPAPATLEILAGASLPVYDAGVRMETVTPTGAALMAVLARGRVGLPSMTVERVGYGAGKQQYDRPNLLRVVIGEPVKENCHPVDLHAVQTHRCHGAECVKGETINE